MTETATTEGRPALRRDGCDPAPVSATALAEHLACTRQYIAKLTAEGVIARSGDGYDQDASRVRYINHLRSENRRSPRAAADAEHAAAKAAWLQLRIAKERRELMPISEHNRIVDDLAGLLLTRLNSLPAQLAGFDLAARRRAESVILAFRREFATACNKLADERGEPDEPSGGRT